MNADVQVVSTLPADGVRVYNGSSRQTYNCSPYCQPAPVLGDSLDFSGANASGAAPINNEIASGTFSNGTATGIQPGPASGMPAQGFAPN